MKKHRKNNKKEYICKSERLTERLLSEEGTDGLARAVENGLILRTVRICGFTPLEFAVFKHNVPATKWMTENCPELMFADELTIAAADGNAEIMDILLSAGDTGGKNGFAEPLRMAVQEGRTEIVKMLLDRGADMWRFDAYADAPIYTAAAEGHGEIVDLLLERGKPLEGHEDVLIESMTIAGCWNNLSIVKTLEANGVDINGCDHDGRPLLFYAMVRNNDELLAYLFSRNCKTDAVDSCGVSVKRMLNDAQYRRFVTDAVARGEY